MDVRMNKEGAKLTVEVVGRLDTMTSPQLEKSLSSSLDGIKELIIDLKELEYISSAGLRVLIGAARAMAPDGEMKVANPNESIMDVFSLTGFDSALTIIRDPEE